MPTIQEEMRAASAMLIRNAEEIDVREAAEAREDAAEVSEDAAAAAERAANRAEVARLNSRIALLLNPVTPPVVTPPNPGPVPVGGIVLRGNKIFAGGREFVGRGPELFCQGDHGQEIDAIHATGANFVRVLLCLDRRNGYTPAQFDQNIFARLKGYGMVAAVSVATWNDADDRAISPALGGGNFYSLGGGSRANPAPCYLAMWERPWLRELAQKYEANIIVDAAQEHEGRSPDTAQGRETWAQSAIRAIEVLRGLGYKNVLEIMSNYYGRDLFAIMEHGARIRAADRLLVGGEPQTMFGWQAYWRDANNPNYYADYQGGLILGAGRRLTGPEAIRTIAPRLPFPVQVGIDSYVGDTSTDWRASIDEVTAAKLSALWWAWNPGQDRVDAPVGGTIAQNYVHNWFRGAIKLQPQS